MLMETESNITDPPPFLYMESLGIPPSRIYPAFIMGTVTYCFIVAGNLTIFLTITLNRSLHKPMYLLLLNLPLNDLMGATAFFPQMVISIILQDRTISHAACFLQAVLLHLYTAGAYIILTVMAYDRFLAICCPLRYNSYFSRGNLLRLVVGMWLLDLVVISVLFCLLSRLRFCRPNITDLFCNNASLVKLVCGDTRVNNYYGLVLSSLLQSWSLLTIIFTYIQILVTCLIKKQSDAKSKAIRTCSTHLIVYLVFQVTSISMVVLHRFSAVSPFLRRLTGVSIIVFPPILNPLIYGLNTKEIRSRVIQFFAKKRVIGFDA